MPEVSYYVSAHPDDAILFRGEQLYEDLHTPGVEVVHVCVSAGDGGRTDGYWQRREQGLVRAMAGTMDPNGVRQDTVLLGGRLVTRYAGRGWWLYCLRLPDGGLNGQGHGAYGGQAVPKLRSAGVPVRSVDGAADYPTWATLTETLRAIVQAHRTPGSFWVNSSDPSTALNPGDHPDHYAVANAVQTVANQEGLNRWWWVSYATQNRPPNLGGLPLEQKRFLFALYGWWSDKPNELEWTWWGDKSYGRAITLPGQ